MSFLNAVKIKLGLNASATDNFVLESTGQGSGQIRKGDLATTGNTLMNWNSGGVNGIAFAPTQVASSDPNTLDDYEEGTWTPNQGAGLTVVGAFSSFGYYTKIGRQVTIYGKVIGQTSIAVSGSASVISTNLPFPVMTLLDCIGVTSNYNWSATSGCLAGGGSSVLYSVGSGLVASGSIQFSVTYFTA